jgi:hypothetical protein
MYYQIKKEAEKDIANTVYGNPSPKQYGPWDENEVQFARKNYPKMSTEEISHRLGHQKFMVERKLYDLIQLASEEKEVKVKKKIHDLIYSDPINLVVLPERDSHSRGEFKVRGPLFSGERSDSCCPQL